MRTVGVGRARVPLPAVVLAGLLVLASATAAIAVATGPSADSAAPRVQTPLPPPVRSTNGLDSPDHVLVQQAAAYAAAQLGRPISRTEGIRRGGECAVVEVVDDRGTGHRVTLIALAGDPAGFAAYAVSQVFRLDQFVPDSDGACGMDKAGALTSRTVPVDAASHTYDARTYLVGPP